MTRLTRPLAIIAALLVTALVVVGIVIAFRRNQPAESATRSFQTTIPAADGIKLAAEVTEPKSGGPFPLVVMPASWGEAESEYDAVAQRLAQNGFAVVAYTQRGFKDSGGTVDFAAAPTRADVSTVITWSLAHTSGDAKHIGVMGASYGGGIALLAAEHDPRIKSVVALSTWADWGQAFLPRGTVSVALRGLLSTGAQTGHLDAQLTALLHDLKHHLSAAVTRLRAMSAQRSPLTDVAALNRNGTAVMIANGLEDSVVPPGQLVPFFEQLTTPKRLQLAPGDHLGPESSGLQGYDNEPIDDGIDWLEHYLAGTSTHIDRQQPVQVQDVVSGDTRSYPNWPPAGRTLLLDAPDRHANLVASKPVPWLSSIKTGKDSAADSGAANISSDQYSPPSISETDVGKQTAFAWATAPFKQDTVVTGSAKLTVRVTASARTASFYAYLYDVDAVGEAQLMSVTPYTATRLSANKPTVAQLDLQPVAWTVSAKHSLALVIDTVDPRYASTAHKRITLTLSSSAADQATLQVPIAK